MDELLYGVAYYDEYMPYDRLDTDVEMMKKAGINLIRIAESTWSTLEPEEGVFDFGHIDRVLNAMGGGWYPCNCGDAYLCSPILDGEEASRHHGDNPKRQEPVWRQADYGHHQ